MVGNSDPFLAFIRLVEQDQKINHCTTKQQEYAREIDRLKRSIEEQQASVAAAQDKVQQLRKQLASHELTLKTVQNRERTTREKLDLVASAKEYSALEAELKLLQTQKVAEEEQVFLIWDMLEMAESKSVEREQEAKLHQATTEEKIVEMQKATQSYDQEILVLQADRVALLKAAPADFVAKYESMRATVANPVVPLVGDHCSFCETPVTPATYNQLKRHILVACGECYRLLYKV
jgi:predicted  nucleic acid-binding Zn-ribbon protein